MNKLDKLDSIAIVPPKQTSTRQSGALIFFTSSEIADITVENQNADATSTTLQAEAVVCKALDAATKNPKETRLLVRLAWSLPEWRRLIHAALVAMGRQSVANKIPASFFSSPKNKKSVGRRLDDNDDVARIYELMQNRRWNKSEAARAYLAQLGLSDEQANRRLPSLLNKLSTFGRAYEVSRAVRIIRFSDARPQQKENSVNNKGGGNGGGSGGSGGGKSSGGGRGQGNAGGWPSATGKPSGGGRSNAPASGGKGNGGSGSRGGK
jgi:uncharacterized membrane protein YgcG